MATVNRQITLAARPEGLPKVSDFELVFAPIPTPAPGEVLVRALYLSLDPGIRSRMGPEKAPVRPLALGEVICGGAVSLVINSGDPTLVVGDVVEGMVGWQEYAALEVGLLRKIDPDLAPISTALGVLGLPGLTALFGLLEICTPQRGETAVVSGAAGGVGMVVGQIAKLKGCRVVGVTGTDAKVSWLIDELGFDAAFNCKTAAHCDRHLHELCPDGIDVYFDSVGGEVTDAVVRQLNPRARISVCGQLSQYDPEQALTGPRWLSQLVIKEAKVQGFLVSTYAERFAAGRLQLGRWLKQGKLRYREDVALGIESAPQAFIGMLQGRSEGKQLVQMSDY